MQQNTEVKILQYKTNVGYFVKVQNAPSYNTFSGLLINDLSQEDIVIINGYAKLENEVTSVKRETPSTRTVEGYTLKDKELESTKLPLVVQSYWDEELEETKLKGVEGYESLYEPVYVVQEGTIVAVPFSIIDMGEYIIDEPSNIKSRKIKMKGANDTSNTKLIEEELSKVVIYDDIIKLLTPEFALTQAPCKLSSHQMFRIVRQYLVENLDMKENVITSNYDFCFTVKKRVHTKPFISQESYYSGKKLKTKNVTLTEKLVEVFEMTYAGYKGAGGYEGYTCIPELHGDNLEYLANKLDSYLENLVKSLNAVVKECECCNGTGHIVKKGKV